jgi:hypothetical protein
MIFKFTILSDESDTFLRIVTIDAEATFLDFNNAILKAVNYGKDQITSFFICDDDWEKDQEITLIEMDTSSEFDNLIMEDTKLEDLLTDEKQKLMYVFDMLNDRAFYIELSEIITGKNQPKPECIKSVGKAPVQVLDDFNLLTTTGTKGIDENFYGDEDFNADELDEDGFGDMNFDDSSLFMDDGKLF